MGSTRMKRKILYISGTRADYGLMRPVLKKLEKSQKIDLEIVTTGMHVMEEFGMTINEIKKDGFKIHEIKIGFPDDDKFSTVNFIGNFIILLGNAVKTIKPDIILLLGDRAEMLAGAIVGMYLNIPVAHIHGGEISSTVDEYARHAITKLSNIHLPATEKSAERIKKMGESPENIFVVGAPGLDNIFEEDLVEPEELSKKYDINLSKPLIMVVQHPVSLEFEDSTDQIIETLEAIVTTGYQTIIIFPNADAGGRKIIKTIKSYEKYPFIKTFKSIPNKDYLSLMNIASVLVGNSSSGIIEAPSMGLPVINIGSRQDGRERGQNIIDVGYNRSEIKIAIDKAINDNEFMKLVKKCQNPYGDGNASTKIVEILSGIPLNQTLLNKQLNI